MNRHRAKGILAVALSALLLCLLGIPASAHPISQGAMKLTLFSDRIELEARLPFEEVLVASTGSAAVSQSLQDGLKAHGAYLLTHIQLASGGKILSGRVLSWTEGANSGDWVTFTLRYELSPDQPHAEFQLSQNILREIEYAPGNPWEATYIVSVLRSNGGNGGNGGKDEGMLLTGTQSVSFPFERDANSTTGAPGQTATSWATFEAFCWHGIMHILTGYDHLLFIATLVLAATRFWDLFKVVAAFTLAHGLTLTLSVLDIVRLSERIVEPMIAASIVFVAVENVFFPQRSRNWTRLCAAFFFGLFHGLGFAGGLLEAMAGMPGSAIAVALIAFSLGVELGHQAVVVPLYIALSAVRSRQRDEAARAQISARMRVYASAAISIAGLFYLAIALGWRF